MKNQQSKEMAMVCVDMMVSTLKTLETVDGEMDGKPLEKTKVSVKTAAKEKPTDSTNGSATSKCNLTRR